MALQVWLPLNGNLNNQGLANVTVTNYGATVDSNGKIGSCYSFDGSNDRIQISNAPTPTDISVAMWFKRNANTGTRQFLYTQWQGITLELDTGGTITCSIYTSDGQTGYCRDSTSITTSSGWNHIVFSYKNGVGTSLYLNGELLTATSVVKPIQWGSSIGNIGYFNTYFNGCINDFRIYDHCLSPKEVKEISKGLVLHYTLSGSGENLVWNSNWNLHTTTPPENWINWGAPPTREIVTIDGKNWLHVISNTTTFQGYCQNWSKRNGVGELTGGQIVTVSFTAYLASAATIAPIGIYWNDSSGAILSQNWTTTALTTTPKRYSFTYTTPANCVAFNIMVGDNTNTAHEVWVTDIKLELGETATPWCPSSSDALGVSMGLNDNIEYDVSGYGNNGTKTGTLTYSSDTPRYVGSTKFSNARITASSTPLLYGLSTASLCAWVKLNSYTSDRCMIIFANGRYLTVNDNGNLSGYSYGKTPAGYYNSNATIPLDTWTHLAIVWDDTTWYFYINGQLANSWACTGTFTNSGSYVSVGQEQNGNRSIDGQISDVRIYATALSADDVLALYHTSASISNNGVVFAHELVEG